MKYIDVSNKDACCIKVTDDVTCQDITIYCNNVDQANELMLKLAIELLKGE